MYLVISLLFIVIYTSYSSLISSSNLQRNYSKMQSIICKTPSQFKISLQKASSLSLSEKKPLIIAFLGEKVAATGMSWCPDCVAAEPIIQTSLQSMIQGCVYLECIVKREEYKVAKFES